MAQAKKLAAIFATMGAPEKFRSRYYDVQHSLNIKMQYGAIELLKRWLFMKK